MIGYKHVIPYLVKKDSRSKTLYNTLYYTCPFLRTVFLKNFYWQTNIAKTHCLTLFYRVIFKTVVCKNYFIFVNYCNTFSNPGLLTFGYDIIRITVGLKAVTLCSNQVSYIFKQFGNKNLQ